MPDLTTQALWYVGPGRAEIRDEPVVEPKPGEVQVRAQYSAISRGTERLILAGRVPPSEFERMRAPFMAGGFPFPVKYGYAVVGKVERGPAELLTREVFVLHPHQGVFNVPVGAVVPVPEGVPPTRAVLAANMETALNGVWDAEPGPARRIAIVGAGVVGALVAFLYGQQAGADVTLVDINPTRTELAREFGVKFARPEAAPGDCDLVVHASGTAEGLATSLALAGFEATVLEMSWYGDAIVPVPLGGAFHSRRLKLVSSQVGHVAPSHRADWTHARRLAAAVDLLADARLDALLSPAVAFRDLPAKLTDILDVKNSVLCQLVNYQ
ncbi:MAG: zinc-binding alcohol dehydrogenase [Pseudolabrys sp.]